MSHKSVSHSEAQSLVLKLTKVECTELARHDEDYAEPWLILTDLPPEVADEKLVFDALLVADLFKDSKRGGNAIASH